MEKQQHGVLIGRMIEHTPAFRNIQLQVWCLLDHSAIITKENVASAVQKNHTLAEAWNCLRYRLEHHYPFWEEIRHRWQLEVVGVALMGVPLKEKQ